jgi:cytoskeletal protein RodZ
MQTIGQRLKAAREEKHLPLEKVFEATRIRVQYLKALEDDDLSSMPSPVQARGYLRNYAEYLGLNFDQLLEELRSEKQSSDEIIGPADIPTEPTAKTLERLPVEEVAPPPQVEVDTGKEADPQPFDVVPDEPEPTPATPKHRKRKVELEPVPIPVVESQPEIVEEPVPQPEADLEEAVETRQEEQPKPDVSDNLWQTWLNRLGSVVSVWRNRKLETQVEETKTPESPIPQQLDPEPVQSEVPEPSDMQQSTEIFKEIGAALRTQRETLSLNLEEVERNTHVKAHYLEALEKGAMDKLPSTVQTRGMLSNYASFLDLDVDTLLLRFADGLQARHRERNPQKPARTRGQPILASLPPVRNFIAGDMVFGIGMAILLVGFAIWGINRVLTLQNLREIQPTAPSISDVLLASPDPSEFTATPAVLSVESIPGEATATIIIPTLNVNVRVQVNLVAVERTYMRVITDGRTVFDGRVVPGNAYPFEAENQIEVLVGSGTAVRVVYNGRDLGLLGGFGQVVSNIFTANEIITPTALPSPTATNTLSPTPTLRPTSTLRPTNTPVPSRTPLP